MPANLFRRGAGDKKGQDTQNKKAIFVEKGSFLAKA